MGSEKRNAPAREVARVEPGTKLGAGEYFFMGIDGRRIGIQHGCPCGCGEWSTLFFRESGDTDFWIVEKPFPLATLKPSIGMWRGQSPYHWHGYLTDGVFVEI
jgi:hypothetical protein